MLMQSEKNVRFQFKPRQTFLGRQFSFLRLRHHSVCETFLGRGRRYFLKYLPPSSHSPLKDLLRISWPQSLCASQLVFIPSHHRDSHTRTHTHLTNAHIVRLVKRNSQELFNIYIYIYTHVSWHLHKSSDDKVVVASAAVGVSVCTRVASI